MPALALAEVLLELSRTLTYIHHRVDGATGERLDAAHLDIKPGNVILGVGGIGLVDFECAKFHGQAWVPPRGKNIRGTPAYMAPEQVCGIQHQIGPQSDIFALGSILYEMLLGQCPFPLETGMGIESVLLKVAKYEEARAPYNSFKDMIRGYSPLLVDTFAACHELHEKRACASTVAAMLVQAIHKLREQVGAVNYSQWFAGVTGSRSLPAPANDGGERTAPESLFRSTD